MAPSFVQRWFGKRPTPRRRWNPRFIRPYIEVLEDRTMLATTLGAAASTSLPGGVTPLLQGTTPLAAVGQSSSPLSIVQPAQISTTPTTDVVVGRTLSSYFAGDVQNNQLTITYTVYNEQATAETGVLLTDTLQPGVTIQSASQQPDQSGQNLAWSLGTIHGFDRASVSLTVNLSSTIPSQIDTGARAFAMLNAGMVSNSTPAATLRQGNLSDPTLLAVTPDANTTDPFIQEEAAKLSYDPQEIFNFLHNDVGYNSYLGSVRGARGTLWSSAGNALDVASLGVALMRGSGIPAQYVQGTLSQGQAQQLILSMFPATYQIVGTIAPGGQTSDPANDPQLLSETESHYWFQFDTGNGMTDADPLIASASNGQTVTTATGTFSQVPDNLRAKTEIQLQGEFYSSASILFGGGLGATTVLDSTFNDVDLVGHPITVGNFVSQSAAGALAFSVVTNTYSPYLEIGDDAFPNPGRDKVIQGAPYQEVLSNFPFSSSVLTGLFLNVTTMGPGANGQIQSSAVQKTLFDRIGYAARQQGSPGTIAVAPTSLPALSNNDVVTLLISPALQPRSATAPAQAVLLAMASQLKSLASAAKNASSATQSQVNQEIASTARLADTLSTAVVAETFFAESDQASTSFQAPALVREYFATPRIVAVSDTFHFNTATQMGTTVRSLDILRDDTRTYGAPGQSTSAAQTFQFLRGLTDSNLEGLLFQQLGSSSGQPESSFQTFQDAAQSGIGLIFLDSTNVFQLSQLNISPDSRARITTAIANGKEVIVPASSVTIQGNPATAWLEIDPVSGNVVAVSDNGDHGIEDIVVREFTLAEGVAEFETGGAVAAAQDSAVFAEEAAQLSATAEGISLKAALLAELAIGTIIIVNAPVARAFATAVLVRFEQIMTAYINAAEPPIGNLIFSVPAMGKSETFIADNVSAKASSGAVTGAAHLDTLAASGQLSASWNTSTTSAFQVQGLSAGTATVLDRNGHQVGSGAVALAGSTLVPAIISGTDQYSVTGTGSLSFYGPAAINLGVSGNWGNYSAIITGPLSITVTTAGLTVNGQALPAGTYTITTTSATVSGSGPTTSPNFAGAASITPTNSAVELGSGTGNVSVGGSALDVSSGATLTGYSGSITIAAGGGTSLESVTLNGNAANVVRVSAGPNALMTDQNTAVTFQATITTSFADTYNLTAQAPPGWTVIIDNKGTVTATPKPGLQSGTYPIRIVAQSMTNSALVAQTTITVTIAPTQPGVTLTVDPDPQFTVPFNGANVPTAFRAIMRNPGPAADTYNLSFANIPSGFTILNSGTSVTVPAGQTGILGLYLQPNPGQPIPAPGTQLSFAVTATSTTSPSITQSQVVNFTVPAIDAVTITSNPSEVASTSGAAVSTTLMVQDVGNVPETVTLSPTLPAGITANTLAPISLTVGQTATATLTLTPDSTVPLNAPLDVTVTAAYGPTATPQTAATRVGFIVRSAQVIAVQQAADAANMIPNNQLGTTLSSIADALAQLQSTPTAPEVLGRVQFLLGNLNTLLQADPALISFVSQLQPIQADATAGNVSGLLALLPLFFNNLTPILTQEAREQFTISVSPAYIDVQTGQTKTVSVQLVNQGSASESLTLTTPGLPPGVTAAFSHTQVTLAPGATDTETLMVTPTTLSNKVFTLVVNAAASVVQHTATAVVAVRQATADVLSVMVNPGTVQPGMPFDVTAQVFNTANATRSVLAQMTILDLSGNVVSTLPTVPVSLVPGAGNLTLDLGQVATTALANGVYTLQVSLLAADGTPLPGHASQAIFAVGQTVTASVAASTSLVPPGTSTVGTTITVNNQTATGGGNGGGPPPGTVPITVEVGYADGLRPGGFFPNPWIGSPNTTFVGGGGTFDSGAILIINNGNSPITVNDVHVTLPQGEQFDLWGSNVVPAGGNLILTQTTTFNFDTSDFPTIGPPTPYPDGETAHASHVDITLNGVLLPTYLDTGHILTTGGFDLAFLHNESQNWRLIGTTGIGNPGGSVVSAVVTDNLPASGYTVDATSITPAATSSSSSQVVWNQQVLSGSNPNEFQLSGTVANVAPGEVRPISTGSTVAVTTLDSAGQPITTMLNLPGLSVAAQHIISINPTNQNVDHDGTVTYQVTLTNPLSTDQTYTLSTDGLAGFTTNLASTVTVPAGQTVTTPLTITAPTSVADGIDGFTIAAQTSAGGIDSVEGEVTVLPQVALPTQAVNVQLIPTTATAGPGTSATYEVQVTNLGDTTDTYSLADVVPAGIGATFAQPTITVPAGLSNFRDVLLTLMPAVGTAAGSDPFSVTATSTTTASVTATANGTLNVLANGVTVTLNPTSGAPGTTFQMTVTNTGKTKDTFTLALASPVGLVAKLATTQVTLAAGASQMVAITTGPINFAVPGPLALTAMATSQTNSAIKAGATASLTIPTTIGLAANFNPGAQTVSIPGTGTFLLQVNNTGNTEDAYTATIMATTGPITAHLMGLDGQPTQSIPVFRLPGLSSGAILLQATQMGPGQGTVTVQVQSLNHANLMAAPIALQTAAVPAPPLPPPASLLSNFLVLGLEISGFSAVGLVTVPSLQVLDLMFGYFPALTGAWGLVATPTANGALEEVFFNGMGQELFALLQFLQAQSTLQFNWVGLSPQFNLQVSVPMPQSGAISAQVLNGQGAELLSTPFFPLPSGA